MNIEALKVERERLKQWIIASVPNQTVSAAQIRDALAVYHLAGAMLAKR